MAKAGRSVRLKGLVATVLLGVLAGCSADSNPRTPSFWSDSGNRTYSALSTDQQNEAAQTAGNLHNLLGVLGPAGEDAADIASLQAGGSITSAPSTNTPSTPSAVVGLDTITLAEITAKCRARQLTAPTTNSQSQNIQYWFDDNDNTSCPVTYAMHETTATDSLTPPVSKPGDTPASANLTSTTTSDWSIAFQAKPNTAVATQGAIRSFTLSHHEEAFAQRWRPNSQVLNTEQLTKTTAGVMVLANGLSVPFSIHHSRDLRGASFDDSGAIYAGRDLHEVELDMPYGAAIITSDTVYDGKTRSPKTLVFVNGQQISQ